MLNYYSIKKDSYLTIGSREWFRVWQKGLLAFQGYLQMGISKNRFGVTKFVIS